MNEKFVKQNEEIADRLTSEDGIEATQATHPTQLTVNNKLLEEKQEKQGEGSYYYYYYYYYDDDDDDDDDAKSSSTKAANMMAATTITTIKPIVSIDQFFRDEPSLSWQPLPPHSLEQSPCNPLIGVDNKRRLYYCKLHPKESESVHLDTVEHHCKYKEPELHKAEIMILERQRREEDKISVTETKGDDNKIIAGFVEDNKLLDALDTLL